MQDIDLYKKMRPVEAGYLAAALEARQEDNPYTEESEDSMAWDWGWKEYMQDHGS